MSLGAVMAFVTVGMGWLILSKTGEQKPLPSETPTAKRWADSVSLPNFMNKKLNGYGLKLGKVLDENAFYTRYFITYQSGDLKISGIMNIPKGRGPFPVLILDHGYIDPKVYTNGRGLKREQDYLAKKGYVVLHTDYRNHAQSDKDTVNSPPFRMGYVEDAVNAVHAVKNSGFSFIDTSRIGMLGHSMGGGICLNVMVTHPELVKAFVLFASVSADVRNNFYRWDYRRPGLSDKIFKIYGSPQENPEFWNRMSPMFFLDQIRAPVLIHHGTDDESCPIEWSRTLNDSLKEHKKNVTFYEYPKELHEFINAWPLVMERTASFFDTHLKN